MEVCSVPKRILIVEDERLLRKTLSDALGEQGYIVEVASTAAQAAQQLFPASEYDLIVLDQRLPDGSGVEVLRRIRDEGMDGSVMVMTAYGTTGLERELRELGVDGFVSKPFDLGRFLESIADVVGGSTP